MSSLSHRRAAKHAYVFSRVYRRINHLHLGKMLGDKCAVRREADKSAARWAVGNHRRASQLRASPSNAQRYAAVA